jgi:Regulator of ribonuclease activity B
MFESGTFHIGFPDERSARAAARDTEAGGFVAELRQEDDAGWMVLARRRTAFPADERERYASRLRTVAATHGGHYGHFVADEAG